MKTQRLRQEARKKAGCLLTRSSPESDSLRGMFKNDKDSQEVEWKKEIKDEDASRKEKEEAQKDAEEGK